MDVHRARFVPYPASAISAVAFSQTSSDTSGPTNQLALKLALGRANGDIEIWNPQRGQWVQETIFPGDHRGIDGLVWTREPDEKDAEEQVVVGEYRLFSIASSPAITEWDLVAGRPKKRSTGNFSEVWCFAAQPETKKSSGSIEEPMSQDLIAGCGDGTLVVLSTSENDLQFKRFLARVSGKKARCMSITYQTRDRVIAGFADSVIRIFDTRNGFILRSMSLGNGVPEAPKNTLVWQVRCLRNGDIVSGDSTGEVKIWDGKSYSLLQRISGHETDCLDIVTSADGKMIFSGSIDGRIAVYRHAINPTGRPSWAKTHHRRIHSGEVKSMAGFDSLNMSVLVSGGSDTSPVITPLREYGKEGHRNLPALPQYSPIVSASRARLLASWCDKEIRIWRINPQSAGDFGTEPPRRLVAKMSLETDESIRDVSINNDGQLLAACTNSQLKVFQLRTRLESDSLAIRKLELPDGIEPSGARLIKFSPNGKWLAVVTPDSEVHIIRIAPDSSKPKRLQLLSRSVELDRRNRNAQRQVGFRYYERSINNLAFAPDSTVLVAGDLSGHLDSWVLKGNEDSTAPPIDIADKESDRKDSDDDESMSSDDDDSVPIFYGQHWTDNPAGHLLPHLDSTPLVLSFRPSLGSSKGEDLTNGNPGVHSTRQHPHAHSHDLPRGQHLLWIMTARHDMYELDVLAGSLSEWSRRNPSSVLPVDFVRLRDRVKGAIWDVTAKRQRIWVYGSSFLFMLNVGVDLSHSVGRPGERGQKRVTTTDVPSHERLAKKSKVTSGAGWKVRNAFREGVPSSIRRLDDGAWTDVNVDQRSPAEVDEDEEDDDSEDDPGVAAQLRLTRLDTANAEHAVVPTSSEEPHSWLTFKYRPILGMVALGEGSRDGDEDGGAEPLEVVIVEQPPWDKS